MARKISIGAQDFAELIRRNNFYIDKTHFIKEWWENEDIVTLITRPRRFGKTLNLSMLECFFSLEYSGHGELFENLAIWEEENYRELQGTYPVISLSFAGVKANNYSDAREQIFQIIIDLYAKNEYLTESDKLGKKDKEFFDRVSMDMSSNDAAKALHQLSCYLYRYYGKKVIILLDEYDTPMQEAYVNGYWKEIVSFTRTLFNNTFKTNPYLKRAVMTGITRVSKESLFSDLNNLRIITTTSNEYASCFGFTENEVFHAMDEFAWMNKNAVKEWYDGFTIGNVQDIYNPWSIINFLKEGDLKTYWANTSSNGLAGSLLRKGNKEIKMQFEELLHGHSIKSEVDEEIVFDQLDQNENAIWSLLLASGYLKVIDIRDDVYTLELTNYEVKKTFFKMVKTWFRRDSSNYNDFIKALLLGDVEAMNIYMNKLAAAMFSSFDVGNKPSQSAAPERLASCCDHMGAANGSSLCESANLQCEADASQFYHGFVLGLLVDLAPRYEITSNRESGFGRYDVMLRPHNPIEDDGIILEFKVYNHKKEAALEDTVHEALKQIEEKKYEQALCNQGIDKAHIRKYGFAFEGKSVLIG